MIRKMAALKTAVEDQVVKRERILKNISILYQLKENYFLLFSLNVLIMLI